MIGKWDKWYKNVKTPGSFRYGNTKTYQLAGDFLADCETVEDWGCGTCGFKEHCKGKYIGVDGSKTPFTDVVADLRTYLSRADGIMMRHVLEHNYDWKDVLLNALHSFEKKLCIVLFTPFVEQTGEIAHNKKHGVDVPDIAFNREELEEYFDHLDWRMETHRSGTHYGEEHIYYIKR